MSWQRITTYVRGEFSEVATLPHSQAGRLLFVVILLVGIGLRFGALDWGLSYTQPAGPPHHDEPHVMYFLKLPWDEFTAQFHEYEIVRPVYFWRVIARPIFILGEKAGWNTSQNQVYEYAVTRGINATFGVIGLLVIYGLAVRLAGVRAGLLAMALTAVLPGHWYYSQLLKGDLLVAVYDALLLLCAIRIYDRGSKFWYVLAGVAAGVGVASKPSVVIILPIVLLAHVLRAVSEKNFRTLVSVNAILTLLVASAAFFLFYPYPYLNAERWWKAFTEPTTQFFRVNWKLTPGSLLTTWRDYNEPPRVFMEMIFGEALRRVFPLVATVFVVLTAVVWRTRQRVAYILTAIAALIVYHSLSFTGPLDDRYALPLSTFVVLFPAVLAGDYPFVKGAWRVSITTLFVLGLLVYTAAHTWAIFPTFAFGKDVRVATVEYIESRLKPGDVVGEFEAGGRQSLPFDRGKIVTTRIRTHEDDPHMYLFSQPKYVVVPVEPENYDHAFRYQLHTLALQQEFPQYLQSYRHLRRFGVEPHVFGRQLPRMLSTPIFDVYQYAQTPLGPPQRLAVDQNLSASELVGKLLTFTFDISDVQQRRGAETLPAGVIVPYLLFDNDEVALARPLPSDETDVALYDKSKRFGLVIPLKHDDLKDQNELKVAYYIRPEGRIDAYMAQYGQLIGRAVSSPQVFSTAQIGWGVEADSPMPVHVRLKDVTLQTPGYQERLSTSTVSKVLSAQTKER